MQKILTGKPRTQFDNYPERVDTDDLARYFTLSDALQKHLAKRRGEQSRLTFAMQGCWLEYLGWIPQYESSAPRSVIQFIARQLKIRTTDIELAGRSNWYWITNQVVAAARWKAYSKATKELHRYLSETASTELNKQQLLGEAVKWLHGKKVLRLSLSTLEEAIAGAATNAQDCFNQSVITAVDKPQRRRLMTAVKKLIANVPTQGEALNLQQLKAPPGEPSERNLNRLLDNIEFMQELGVDRIDLSHLSTTR